MECWQTLFVNLKDAGISSQQPDSSPPGALWGPSGSFIHCSGKTRPMLLWGKSRAGRRGGMCARVHLERRSCEKKKCMVFPSAKANESPGRLLFHLPICVLMDLNSLHTVHHVFADQSLECVHLSVKINPLCPLLFGESHIVGISPLIEDNSSKQGLQTPRPAV